MKYAQYPRWERMFPQDVMAVIKETGTVYFPFGCVEEHGTHNTLTVDYDAVHRIALKAAETVPGVVYPPLLVAPPGNPIHGRLAMRNKANLHAPSVFLSGECCRIVYEEMLENFACMGTKLCVALGGHYPAMNLMEAIAKDNDYCVGSMKIVNFNWFSEVMSTGKFNFPVANGHGGAVETSLSWTTGVDAVDKSRIHEVHGIYPNSQLSHLSSDDLDSIARDMSLELGQAVFDTAVEKLIDKLT